jgi:hypothetical protein
MSRINVMNSSEDSIGADDLSFDKDEEGDNSNESKTSPN